METKKYKLTDEAIEFDGHTLYRIKALKSFGTTYWVNKGDLGGYVESESNLSHEGDCWIFHNAKVYGKAHVLGDAKISGNAKVYEKASVKGNSIISGSARVYGKATIDGDTEITEGTFNGEQKDDNADETKVEKSNMKHYIVEVSKINDDLSHDPSETLYIDTDITDNDYLCYLIKKQYDWLNIPIAFKFSVEPKHEVYTLKQK